MNWAVRVVMTTSIDFHGGAYSGAIVSANEMIDWLCNVAYLVLDINIMWGCNTYSYLV